MSKKSNSGAVLAALLAGAATGVILGLLYAPEEGAETRKKIKDKANDLKDKAVDEYGRTSEVVKDKYSEVSTTVKDKYNTLSSTVKETAQNVASTVKDSYDKYKDQIVSSTSDVVKDVETELDGLK